MTSQPCLKRFAIGFGIDIVNRTNIHHKVAAHVVCVFSEQDVLFAAYAEQRQNPHMQHGSQSQSSSPSSISPSSAGRPQSNGNTSFSFARDGSTNVAGRHRQRARQAPKEERLTFDHTLSRFQGEVQRTRETGESRGTRERASLMISAYVSTRL